MLAPGTRLGPYTIVELIAVGGMGEVYRAEDARLHRDVAIKVLPPHLANDQASLDRFQREARAVASLSHPNILSIFDYGEEDGVQYAVTEMLEGRTLRSRLADGRLAPGAALELLLQIGDGVAAAHARGIEHRDLKPENISITSSGRVKVLDFGLARGGTGPFAPMTPAAILPTEPGVVLGTVGYLAPEQVEARAMTPAADVFALGCILFEMVSGHVPFAGTSSVHAMVAVLHDSTPRLPKTSDPLTEAVDAIVQRCLEKSPAARFANAGELADAIRDVLSGGQATARLTKQYRRTRARTLVRVGAAVLVLLIAAAAFLVQRNRNRQLDQGYDVRASDVRADEETKRILELALHADAEGNRPKAIQLLSEASRRPSQTPLPAAFLSSFYNGAGNEAMAEQWGAEARKRLEGASAYESLLVRFLTEHGNYSASELALAKSALELRPRAWRLRLAAAHTHLGHREREAARRELQAIDVAKPDDRRLMLVLADRASLGDIDGAERALRASRLVKRPAMLHYTEGRIAWSRRDPRRAHEMYDRAASEAATESLAPLQTEAHLLSGIALVRLGRWEEAQRRFSASANLARQTGLEHRVFESSAFAAYAAHHAGDFEERDRKLEEAMAVEPPAHPLAALRLLAIRLGSPVWTNWSVSILENEPQLASTMSLIRAREAMAAGDAERAKLHLRRARAEGIDVAEEREDAELLAAELGLPATLLPPDPPYPNMLRYLAIFDHERISTATGASR